jgi:uncharacterized protein (TIGR03437 family)
MQPHFLAMKQLSISRLTLICLTLLAATVQAQTPQTATYSYSGQPVAIPLAGANLGLTAEIYVPATVAVTAVTAQVQIQYPNVGDLKVYLFSANGTRTILLQNECNGLANVNTTFDDTAQTKYSSFCPVEPGRGPFRPDEPLANSKGEFSAGYWQIFIQNTKSNSNTGTLQAFSLTISGTPVTTPQFNINSVANSASLDSGAVAPGELVSIFGVALGPNDAVTAPSGPAPTSLAGTSVTFDGIPAPVTFSSYYQVNVQAPYTLIPGSNTHIQINTSNGASSSVKVPVLSSLVGLFTTQTNGRGPALALNQDGTPNSAANPAPAGSYISLFASGLGAVSPAVAAGAISTASPTSAAANVSAIVGGLSAPVSFAGLAPGYIGLYQINAQIPPTAQSGPNLVFLVAPNGYSSQGRTYIYVQ